MASATSSIVYVSRTSGCPSRCRRILSLVIVGLSLSCLIVYCLLVIAHLELVSYACPIIISSVHIKLLLALHRYSCVIAFSQASVVYKVLVGGAVRRTGRVVGIGNAGSECVCLMLLLLFGSFYFITQKSLCLGMHVIAIMIFILVTLLRPLVLCCVLSMHVAINNMLTCLHLVISHKFYVWESRTNSRAVSADSCISVCFIGLLEWLNKVGLLHQINLSLIFYKLLL